MTLQPKKKKTGGTSLPLMDDLDATVRGPGTCHRRRAPLRQQEQPGDEIGEHEKGAAKNTTSGNGIAIMYSEARHRPDEDVRRKQSSVKLRGGLLGRILFGAKSSRADVSSAPSRNDRSSAVTHATHRSSVRSSVASHDDDATAVNDCGSSEAELAQFLRQAGTSAGPCAIVNDLIEQRRWDVLWKYLQTRCGREEVLGLDLDAEIPPEAQHADHDEEHAIDEEHDVDDEDTSTTASTTMSNPLHLALWNGAPAEIVARLVEIRPSLAVRADAFGRAALHVACLTAHLDLGLLEDGGEDGEDAGSEEEDGEDGDEDNTGSNGDGEEDERHRHRARRAKAAAAARRHAQRLERIRIFATLCTLIAADPSTINRPEAEGLCCIEIAILCGAHSDVVCLLRKCSEAHWKEVGRVQKVKTKTRSRSDGEEEEVMTTTTVNGQRLVESVVAGMVARGILSASFAAAVTVGGAASSTSNTDINTDINTADPSSASTDAADGPATAGRSSTTTDPNHHHRPPLRRGNSWWRRRKRTTLSDYLTQSFHKAGPLLATLRDEMGDPIVNENNDDHHHEMYETKSKKKASTTKNGNDKTYKTKTKKRTTRKKTARAPPAERAYARYDIAPAVDIDHEIMGGIFAHDDDDDDDDDDAFSSYGQAPPAGMASATSSSKSGSTDQKMLKAAKTSYEPHPYLTFGSEDSDSVNSLASSSEFSGGGIPLRDDDRNTYRAVTA